MSLANLLKFAIATHPVPSILATAPLVARQKIPFNGYASEIEPFKFISSSTNSSLVNIPRLIGMPDFVNS